MKAEELYIGKYYQADIQFPKGSIEARVGFGTDRVFQFTEHVAKVVFTSYSTGLDLKMFINPIPLTEEWLLKFGLKKEKVSSYGGADMWQGMGAYSYNGEWLFRGNPKSGLKLYRFLCLIIDSCIYNLFVSHTQEPFLLVV